MPKDWNAVARALSSPESSDAEDEANLQMFKKNASRAVELLHSFVPGLAPELAGAMPKGMNRADAWRADLGSAFRASGTAHARPSTAPGAAPKPPSDPIPARPASATPHAGERAATGEAEKPVADASAAP